MGSVGRAIGLALEKNYGVRPNELTIHQRVEKASFAPNDETVTLNLGSKDPQKARKGYMQPEGSTESTMDSKTFHYFLMAILGNYSFTEAENDSEKNKHEFYGGENQKLPSFSGDFVADHTRKMLYGLQADEMKIEIKDDLINNAMTWIHKTEKWELLKDSNNNLIIDLEDQGLMSTSNYNMKTVDGIPYIGYDGTLKLNGIIPATAINDATIEIKVNHNRDGAKSVFDRVPTKKPSTQEREISISLSATMDKEIFKLIVAAEYGVLPTDAMLQGEITPTECKLVKVPVELKLQTCEETDEYVKFVFPSCLISVDPVEVSGTDDIEVSFNLTPMGGKTVSLLDNTSVETSVYAVVVNDQDKITAT